jgi:hypothetical protein
MQLKIKIVQSIITALGVSTLEENNLLTKLFL